MKISENGCCKIDTKGICLLCLTPTPPDLCTVPVPFPQTNNSKILKQLLRYIKVKPFELFGNSAGTTQSLVLEHEVNVQVSTCSLCSNIIKEFGQLYASYVLIMVQMDNCVTSVAHSIKTGNKSPEKTQQFHEQIKPKGFADMINFTFASNLRSVVLEKSIAKLQIYNLESEKQTSERFSACNQTTQNVKNSQDMHMTVTNVESVIESPDNKFNKTNRQHNTSSFSGVSYTEELTSQSDNVNLITDTNTIPLEFKKTAKGAAMVKILKGHPSFNTKTYLRKQKRVKCIYCNKKLCSIYSLERHMKLVHSGNDKSIKIKCKACTRVYNSFYSLKRHMNSVHPGSNPTNDVSRLKCKVCFQHFCSLFSLNQHMERKHPASKLLLSQPSSQAFPEDHRDSSDFSNSESEEEITEQANSKLTAFDGDHKSKRKNKNLLKCKTCKKIFPTNFGLIEHMKNMHEEKYSLNGNQSPNKITPNFSIVTLVETNPDGKQLSNPERKKHVCSTCGKRYARKDSLQRHMRSHTGDKPYLCLHCPTTFPGLHQLQTHEQNFHPDQGKVDEMIQTPTPSLHNTLTDNASSEKSDEDRFIDELLDV